MNCSHLSAAELDHQEMEKVLTSSLNFLVSSQISNSEKIELGLNGEWKNYIYLNGVTLPGRKNKSKFLDANSFTTSSIYDLLSSVFESNPEKYQFLIPTMNSAISSLEKYHSKDTFNFWPLLPKKDSTDRNIRRPLTLPLKNTLERRFVNITNDADDTALAYRALSRHKTFSKNDERFTLPFDYKKNFEEVFEKYRDSKRSATHLYNYSMGGYVDTDAYLTWFGKESNTLSSLITWIPLNGKPNIPLSVNDVDCVVNANVLTTLGRDHLIDTAVGASAACAFINKTFSSGHSKTCGIYYPSEYTLHFSASNAYKSGASCLQDSVEVMVKEITNDQLANGSFISKWHDSDSIQPTAYALNALLNLRSATNKELVDPSIQMAIKYLLSQKKITENGETYWNGGAFFSGGTVIRKKVLWVSDAYTTALIASALNQTINLLD